MLSKTIPPILWATSCLFVSGCAGVVESIQKDLSEAIVVNNAHSANTEEKEVLHFKTCEGELFASVDIDTVYIRIKELWGSENFKPVDRAEAGRLYSNPTILRHEITPGVRYELADYINRQDGVFIKYLLTKETANSSKIRYWMTGFSDSCDYLQEHQTKYLVKGEKKVR